MLKTQQLSVVGRLALALAIVLALVATGALVTTRMAGGTPHSGAALGAIQPFTAAAQGIVPPPAPNAAAGIMVYGDGEATGTPDQAFLNLGVQTDGQTAKQAMDANATAMAAVIDAVKRAGIPDSDIRTTGVGLTPLMSQPRPGDQSPPQVVGYRATNGIAVTVNDITKTGPVLDAGIAAGATNAGGVRFAIKDQSGLRQKALDDAARAARAKADVIAGSLGVHVTGVAWAAEQSTGTPQPRDVQPLAAAAAAPSTPIQTGELSLRVRLQVSFSYA